MAAIREVSAPSVPAKTSLMPPETSFKCPQCETAYKVVRVEASPTDDISLVCLSCGEPLQNRDGKFALKYFRTEY